jgi:hypothetical protein
MNPEESSLLNNVSSEMMNTLDNLKETLTDDTYKQLCDKLMDLYKIEKSVEEYGFYELTIINTAFNREDYDCGEYESDLYIENVRVEKRNIKMHHDLAKSHISYIAQHGYIDVPYDVFKDQIQNENQMIVRGHCLTCDEIGQYAFKILKPNICVIKIKKV